MKKRPFNHTNIIMRDRPSTFTTTSSFLFFLILSSSSSSSSSSSHTGLVAGLGEQQRSLTVTTTTTMTETTSCFQSIQELYQAVEEYIRNDSSPDSVVSQTYGYPMEEWCVYNIINNSTSNHTGDNRDSISSFVSVKSIRANVTEILDIDLTGWDEPCNCTVIVDEVRQESSVTTRPAAFGRTSHGSNSRTNHHVGGNTATSTATTTTLSSESEVQTKKGGGILPGTNNNESTTSQHEQDATTTATNTNTTTILYRLIPLKLMALVLLVSLIFAVRAMVDFRRYEGIDPSDQKIAEFELLQLAQEA